MLSVAGPTRCEGIVVYYNTDKLTCQARDCAIHEADSLFLNLKARSCGFLISILAIYRWHGVSLETFLNDLESSLGSVKNVITFCVGDFNLDVIVSNDYVDQLR